MAVPDNDTKSGKQQRHTVSCIRVDTTTSKCGRKGSGLQQSATNSNEDTLQCYHIRTHKGQSCTFCDAVTAATRPCTMCWLHCTASASCTLPTTHRNPRSSQMVRMAATTSETAVALPTSLGALQVQSLSIKHWHHAQSEGRSLF